MKQPCNNKFVKLLWQIKSIKSKTCANKISMALTTMLFSNCYRLVILFAIHRTVVNWAQLKIITNSPLRPVNKLPTAQPANIMPCRPTGRNSHNFHHPTAPTPPSLSLGPISPKNELAQFKNWGASIKPACCAIANKLTTNEMHASCNQPLRFAWIN